ncbi:MAG: subclass B1 metallo-beta-lactamase [Dysgonomonas sp.]|nr:subclass B1 metallo-beta-lactamase [Dysgonomonas sp.]
MKTSLLFFIVCSLSLLGFSQQVSYKRIRVSDDIELIKLSQNAYVHVSVTEIGSFGKVASNGVVLIKEGKAVLLDTPVTNEQTETLVNWIADSLKAEVTKFVPNHWHEDCMGGLEYLQSKDISSYANQMTIDIAKEKGLPQPEQGFNEFFSLSLKGMDIQCYYLGAGHALDNIVVWIPSEKILFAGCMVKDINSNGLGNTVDGDVKEWPDTIQKVLNKFPEAEIVVPGHGEIGGLELVEHTYKLLKKAE